MLKPIQYAQQVQKLVSGLWLYHCQAVDFLIYVRADHVLIKLFRFNQPEDKFYTEILVTFETLENATGAWEILQDQIYKKAVRLTH